MQTPGRSLQLKISIVSIYALILVLVQTAEPQANPTLGTSKDAPNQAAPRAYLPLVFISVLPEIRTKSRVPIFLPSELPEPARDAQHAVVQIATANEYELSLFYELGVGDAGFAASFSGNTTPRFKPQELSNVREVKLAHGILGFFRPISCGGSCAPANLWWEQGQALYQIQLKLSSSLNEQDQKKALMTAASSAILAGPR